jgi:hypothetical protein
MTVDEVKQEALRLHGCDIHIGDCYIHIRDRYVSSVTYAGWNYVEFRAGDQLTLVPRALLGDWYEKLTVESCFTD